MRLEPFTGQIGSDAHLSWMAHSLALNKRASANFARYQARIGRPVPKSATDPRPDPGTLDCDEPEEG